MTYAEIYEMLQQARRDGVTEITIEIDPGIVTVPLDEAIEAFEELAPGESFEIVTIGEPAIVISTGSVTHLANAEYYASYNELITKCGSGANYRSITRKTSQFEIVPGGIDDVTCLRCRKLPTPSL